jgi:Fur family ferric uptake transcriptional regulator
MPHAPHSPPLAVGGIDQVAAEMRRRGDRFSVPRRAVLEALFAADGPVTADQIAEGGGPRAARLDLTSVYRTLEYLEELGVVRHLHLGHGPGLYALTGGEEREYLVCERCDRVTTVESAELEKVRAQIRKTFGYEARFSHFPIVGVCPECLKRKLP